MFIIQIFLQMNSDYQPEQPTRRQRQETLERPSLRSRGLTAADPFLTRERLVFTDLPQNIQALTELKFEQTDKGVIYRKKIVQDEAVEVEVKVGKMLVTLKSGSEYLSEGFRTIAIQMKDMLVDLNKLSKMLKKEQFQQTNYFAS